MQTHKLLLGHATPTVMVQRMLGKESCGGGCTGQTLQVRILLKQTQRQAGQAARRAARLKQFGDFGMQLEFLVETASTPCQKKKRTSTFSYAETLATKEKTQHRGCQFSSPLSDFYT